MRSRQPPSRKKLPQTNIAAVFCIFLLFLKQTLDLVEEAAGRDLCLDRFDDTLDLILIEVDVAEQAFYGLCGIFLEILGEVFVTLELADDFFDFFFDVHGRSPSVLTPVTL